MQAVVVETTANIALIKYWGKRDEKLMLPTKNSLSIAVKELRTTTRITFAKKHDFIEIEGIRDSTKLVPIFEFLQTIKKKFQLNTNFSITTNNYFPSASGLASSASGFAALSIGIASLCNLKLDKQEISMLARLGSGSASRSIYGGFVYWHKGNNPLGSDCYAEQIKPASFWPELRIIIAVTTMTAKKISSRDGMQTSVQTSPLYKKWVDESEQRLSSMLDAINNHNFFSLGSLAEHDWQDMHDVMLSSKPSLNYWSNTSYTIIEKVRALRATGIDCFVTTDAGPHVKILCLMKNVNIINSMLNMIPGIEKIIVSEIGNDPIISNIT